MFIVPGATYRPVSNKGTGITTPTKGLILHAQQGNNSPFGWFNNTSSQDSSTWWVGKDGRIEQYIDPDAEHAWCQAAGNLDFHSVETEGYVTEALTGAQIDALARIYAAGMKRWGWPLGLSESPLQKGFGWHGMGGDAWGNHPNCPGPLRKGQRVAVLQKIQGTSPNVPTPPTPSTPMPRFPLNSGWYGVNDGTALSHSGYQAMDRPAISIIQGRLHVTVDGRFGDQTKAAVIAFQKKNGLSADGKVGPITWAALAKS